MIGQKIGETYELLRLLGQGAMGVVYEAKHVDTGRHVAVKLITDEAARDEQLRARFEREAQTTAKILSPHIVEILGTGCDGASGHPYLVMELLAGENVEQLLARCGRLDPDLVARIGAQACLGLQKAHQAGVVHRDIKPGNLFLARSQGDEVTVKLLDFAVGTLKMDRASATGNESLARSGSIIGSPMYMSPEQARALKSLDYRTDLWSLGMVLYELLSGKASHHDATGLGDLIIAICAEEPVPIHDVVPSVPKPLSDAVHGALRLAVDERYAGAEQMLAALDASLPSGRRISAAMLTAGRAAPAEASPLAGIFDGAPVMETSADDPTQASAKSEAKPRPRPSSPPGIAVEVAKDGPTVSSPIEALVLSAAPLTAAAGSTHAARDEELFGPASVAIEEPVAGAPRPTPVKAGPLGSSLGRAALAVAAGLLVGVVGTVGYGVVAPPDASSAPPPPPPSAPAGSASDARPMPSAAPSAGPSTEGAAEVAETTVRVKVTPPFGAVAVDGARVEITDGAIEITGPVDSAHDVVLTVGGRSITARIVLTTDGPKPAEIVFPGAGGPGGRRPKGKLPDIYE